MARDKDSKGTNGLIGLGETAPLRMRRQQPVMDMKSYQDLVSRRPKHRSTLSKVAITIGASIALGVFVFVAVHMIAARILGADQWWLR